MRRPQCCLACGTYPSHPNIVPGVNTMILEDIPKDPIHNSNSDSAECATRQNGCNDPGPVRRTIGLWVNVPFILIVAQAYTMLHASASWLLPRHVVHEDVVLGARLMLAFGTLNLFRDDVE